MGRTFFVVPWGLGAANPLFAKRLVRWTFEGISAAESVDLRYGYPGELDWSPLADGVKNRQRQNQPQIPFGNDKQRAKALYTKSYAALNTELRTNRMRNSIRVQAHGALVFRFDHDARQRLRAAVADYHAAGPFERPLGLRNRIGNG